MATELRRRQFLTSLITTSTACSVTGCGTVLHPERRGQRSGQLDWRIVGLDAAGLLLFFVPGVIAFAVDFHQGTIFLPAGNAGVGKERSSLVAKNMTRLQMTRTTIEETASAHIGKKVTLEPGAYSQKSLTGLESFWATRDQLMMT